MYVRYSLCLLLLLGCGPSKLPHEGKSVAELRRQLDSSSAVKQAQAALGLSLHGPDAAPAVPRLVELLASTDVNVRRQCAQALGKIGSEAGEAVPSLERLLTDPQWSVR